VKRRQYELAASNDIQDIKNLVAGVEWVSEEEWKSLDVPFIMVHGESDTVTPASGAKQIETWAQNAYQGSNIIPETGHIPMLEKPHLVNPILKKFFEELLGMS